MLLECFGNQYILFKHITFYNEVWCDRELAGQADVRVGPESGTEAQDNRQQGCKHPEVLPAEALAPYRNTTTENP